MSRIVSLNYNGREVWVIMFILLLKTCLFVNIETHYDKNVDGMQTRESEIITMLCLPVRNT